MIDRTENPKIPRSFQNAQRDTTNLTVIIFYKFKGWFTLATEATEAES